VDAEAGAGHEVCSVLLGKVGTRKTF